MLLLLIVNIMAVIASFFVLLLAQVGDDEARRLDTPNPYAALLSSARIEALEGHKSGAIAKRASRIWKQVLYRRGVTSARSNHTPCGVVLIL